MCWEPVGASFYGGLHTHRQGVLVTSTPSPAPSAAPPATGRAAAAVGLTKVYGHGDTRVVALDEVSRRVQARPVHRDHGPVRVRQVDAHALPRRPRRRHQRRRLRRRHRHHHAGRQAAHPAAPRRGRLRLPGVQPAPDADRDREHHAADGHRRPQARPGVARHGRRPHRPARPARAPAERAVRWAAAARRLRPRAGQPSPRSSSPTSPPATSTAPAAPRCSAFLRRSRDGHAARRSSW